MILDIRVKGKDDFEKMIATDFFETILEMTDGTSKLEARFYKAGNNGEFLDDLPSVTVGDHRMFRSRSFQPAGDYTTHAKARVNFNNPDRCKELLKQIDEGLSSETRVAG